MAADSKETLDKVLKVAKEAARLAGKTILEASSTNSREEGGLQIKSSSTDLVTETDQKCEEIVTGLVESNFPDHRIIGEETAGSNKYEPLQPEEPTWTIDPIDGTTNFVHNLQLSCVIISYIYNQQVMVAVIYDPYGDELFWSIKGRGAFLDVKGGETTIPIQVSKCASLKQAVISMDPGYGRSPKEVERFCTVQGKILRAGVRNLRVIGATGLNMAKVAAGRLDAGFEEGSWESGLGPKIWDFAAGKLLVEEAGGITYDIEQTGDLEFGSGEDAKGGGLDLMKRSFFCASTPELAKEILQIISSTRKSLGTNDDNKPTKKRPLQE